MKKKKALRALLSVILILAMLAPSAVPVWAYENEAYSEGDVNETTAKYGDVNGDDQVDSLDVDLLAKYLARDESVTIDLEMADVDKNGTVDLNDLLNLVKHVKGDTNVSLGNTVTVTFNTGEGKPIDPITVVVGSTITPPNAQKDNAVFIGWYTDEELTAPFYSSDPITESVTVYAKYEDISGSPEYTPATFALTDQSANLVFTVERVSGELAPINAVTLISVDGSVAPKLIFTETGDNKWTVAAEGGYTEGASYKITLADGYIFEGKDKSIREASFFIKKEEIANFTTNEDIIYIQDTDSMTYVLSDGTVCEVLDSAVLYNSSDTITGTFSYTGAADIDVGDTLCIYVSVNPTERDYINGNYENDPTAYIVVETISEGIITFRGMTMQGENSDVDKLISLPNTIPFSVLNLPEGDGTIDFGARDLAAVITMYNTGAPETVKVGDFLVFYVGNFGSLRDGDTIYYKRVTAVNGTTITYKDSSKEDFENAINLFLENDVDGEKMLENIDQGQLENQVMEQVEQTGFAEDALEYLSEVITASDEFYEYVNDNKIVVYDDNGVKLTEEQIKAYGLGNSFELADDVELSFNITTCDGENSHFDNGIKVTLKIEAEFEVDIGKDGKMGSLKIELSAAFTQEVFIDVSVGATADITWIVCVPKINDIVFSSAVDVMSYTGVSVEAKFYTQEPDEDFFDKLKENWGDKLGESAMKKIEAFKKEYEEKFDEDSLGEDIEGFWERQTALIEDLIKNGEITEEQAEACMESRSENHIVQTFFSKAHIMDDEEYNAGITELAERYAEMLGEEDNGWLELCKLKMFDVPINLWIFQISIEGNFVVRANVNIALGANLEYEIGKRYVNWFSIFGNGSGAEQLDLVDERFAFQFYAMGHVGLKAGVLIEIKVGVISTKIGNVGISAEVGAFAELYGYFQYTYTKMRPSGTTQWEEEETLMGAIYFEFGLYVDINVKAELLSLLEKEWEVYSGKWTILSAGSKSNIYGFATELEDGEKIVVIDKDSNSSNGIFYQLSEDLRSMKTLDMVSGDQDNVVKPWVSYYGYNFWGGDDYSLTQHEDKANFTYSLTSKYFSLVPVYEVKDGKQYLVDYEIRVDVPENVHYLTCDLRLVWTLDKLCWSKYDMAITIPLVWTDLADEELTEYRTATVKVGNESDGYRTVWSERYIKGSTFELPVEAIVLKLAGYAGDQDIRYSGYTGYTHTNRGTQIDGTEQSMIFDTIYYFDMTTREYQITIEDVQNPDGSTQDMTFTAKYGEKFDYSALTSTGTNMEGKYTIFYGIDAKLGGYSINLDPTGEIKGTFASTLMDDLYTFHAKYINNSGEVTYKFTGINLDPITKIYKKGEMPSSDDFLPAIDAFVGSDMAYVSSISPTIGSVRGDVVYSVTVVLPEKEPEKYTITYVTNGGSEVASQIVEERAVMLPPSDPIRAGYTFAGWYYEADFTTPVNWDRAMPSMDFTLYAKWTANSYTVTFNAGEGTATSTSKGVVYDSAIGALPSASRANYIFLGWYTASSGGTQYMADTVYQTAGNITLYAHWQIKATIASSNVTITNKTTTYNGSSVSLAISNNLGLDMSSFTISYKRQTLDRNWSSALPVNAGTYDVKIKRAEDANYLACEYTYTAKLVINKASRTISSSGLTATVVGGNLSVTSVPSYPGDGTQMFALGSGSFGTSGGFTNLNGTYQVKFYVAEGENYLKSNTVSTGNITVGTPYQPIDMKPTYKVTSYTQNTTASGTNKTVKVWLIHTDGSESSKTTLTSSDINNKGDTCTVTLYPTYDDPWKLYRIKYEISGSDAWNCSGYSLYATVNGSNKTVKSEGSASKDRLFQLDNSASHYRELGSLKRNITGVGNFSGNVNLSLKSSDGLYTFTYNGTVVDQYKSWSTSGSGYNAFYHTDAPTLTLSCSNSTINGFNYAQYFRSNLDTITIDRAGLYKAMVRDGVSSISATATLSFNSGSTASGNTWNKTFNISLPATTTVSEGMDSYYTPVDGNVNVQTKEDTDYLYVTLGLNSNPGIWGIKNTVEFDAEALDLVSVSDGTLSSSYVVETNLNDNQFTLLAYRDGLRESYATGSFVTLTFKKKVENVDLQTALTITNDQTIDDNAQAVIVDGIVNVGDFVSAPPSDDNEYLTDADDLVDILSTGLEGKNTETLYFYYKTTELVTEETLSGWFHTAKDMLSRYDSFGVKRYAATATKYTKDSEFYYTITYKAEYYLTAEEEIELDTNITAILNVLNLDGMTTVEKIAAVYTYVCENVTYDETADNCFTAYGALIDGRAVCQGYALAMMRLLNQAGIEADVVTGISGDTNHMWNIVEIDSEYYLLDATWDSDSEDECYAYFLKGSDDFANHTPTESYTVTLSSDDHEDAHALSHSFSDIWNYDNDYHWHDCIYCDAVNETTAHTDTNFNHICDGGCDIFLGEHKDDDLDRICDYGCTVSPVQDASVPVSYQVEPTYIITIPATVNLGETTTIVAENVVLVKGKQVEVALTDTNDFIVTTSRGAELIYTVKNGETDVNEGDVVLTVNPTFGKTGSTTLSFIAPEDVTFAGEYSGTVTFTISIKDEPNDS